MERPESAAAPVNKPAGMTSFDVVSAIRRKLRLSKAGHSGTLDPFATGVLIILTGEASRLQDFFMKRDKTYRAEFRFGAETDTYDKEGNTTSVCEKKIDLTQHSLQNEIKRLIENHFMGRIRQLPPAYSAVKVHGKRAYELARRGDTPKLKERDVTVYKFKPVAFSAVTMTADITVSSGTYIRAFARDLGRQTGFGAHLESLCRTEACGVNVKDTVDIKNFEKKNLRSVRDFFPDMPLIQIKDTEIRAFKNGRMKDVASHLPGDGLYGFLYKGELVYMLVIYGDRVKNVYNLVKYL